MDDRVFVAEVRNGAVCRDLVCRGCRRPRGVALLCPAHNANATWNANYFAVTVPVDDPREELVTMMAGGYTALA